MSRPLQLGDRVRSGDARGVVLRVERNRVLDRNGDLAYVAEHVYVDWVGVSAALEPTPEALP